VQGATSELWTRRRSAIGTWRTADECKASGRDGAGLPEVPSRCAPERGEKRLRLGDLREFRRRRKAFERWCQNRMRVGGTVDRLIKLRQRQRRLEFEAFGFLLLRNGDSGVESFLRRALIKSGRESGGEPRWASCRTARSAAHLQRPLRLRRRFASGEHAPLPHLPHRSRFTNVAIGVSGVMARRDNAAPVNTPTCRQLRHSTITVDSPRTLAWTYPKR
jgi:hypothetical protein